MTLDLRVYAEDASPSEILAITAVLTSRVSHVYTVVLDIDPDTIAADIIIRSPFGMRHIHLAPFKSCSLKEANQFLIKRLTEKPTTGSWKED